MALLEDIVRRFGEKAPDHLLEGIRWAESDRYRRVLAALLSSLSTPQALRAQEELAKDGTIPGSTRAWAYYGMAEQKTDAAWEKIVAARKRATERNQREFADLLVPALSRFGTRAIPTLVSEKLPLDWLEGPAVREELQRLASDRSAVETQSAALRALSRGWNIEGLPWLVRFTLEEQPSAIRSASIQALGSFVAEIEYGSVKGGSLDDLARRPDVLQAIKGLLATPQDPETLATLVTLRPIREAIPDWFQRLLPGGIPNGGTLSQTVLGVLARCPEHHDALANYLAGQPDTEFTSVCYAVANNATTASSGLASLAAERALDLTKSNSAREAAWALLSRAAEPERERAFAALRQALAKKEDYLGRLRLIDSVYHAGPSANATLLALLRTEPEPVVQFEIASNLFAVRGNFSDRALVEEIQPHAQRWLQTTVLSTQSIEVSKLDGIDLSFLYVNPSRPWHQSLTKYSGLFRDLLSLYGKQSDLEMIRSIPGRLSYPSYAAPDQGTAAWIRNYVWKALEPTVDTIRVRAGR